jgi:hypothetical protein
MAILRVFAAAAVAAVGYKGVCYLKACINNRQAAPNQANLALHINNNAGVVSTAVCCPLKAAAYSA